MKVVSKLKSLRLHCCCGNLLYKTIGHLVDTVIDKGGAVTSWLVRLSPVERSEFEA